MATCSTNVLLGVSGGPCSGPVLSPYENKIGGYPDLFLSSSLPALPHCAICGDSLQLLVQIYCPLEYSTNHRLLHLYCCTKATCNTRNKGWLVLRSEMKDAPSSAVNGASTSSGTTHGTTVCHSRPLAGTTACHSRPLETNTGTTVCHSRPLETNTGTTACHSRPLETNTGTTVCHLRPLETDTGTTVCHSRPLETNTELAMSGWCVGEDEWGEEETSEDSDLVSITQIVNNIQVSDQAVNGIQVSDRAGTDGQVIPKAEAKHRATLPFTGPYFKPMYVNVIEEPSEPSDLQRARELLQRYRTESGDSLEDFSSSSGGGRKQSGRDKKRQGSGSENYEKTVAKHGDRTFEKFKKYLSLCPNQVLRYCWRGKPLLISDSNRHPETDKVTCKSCGAATTFEFQLMPPLVYLLHQNRVEPGTVSGEGVEFGSVSGEGVEFGSVLVYSCSESCWSERDGEFSEESVFVLPDPETEMLNKLTHSLN